MSLFINFPNFPNKNTKTDKLDSKTWSIFLFIQKAYLTILNRYYFTIKGYFKKDIPNKWT